MKIFNLFYAKVTWNL